MPQPLRHSRSGRRFRFLKLLVPTFAIAIGLTQVGVAPAWTLNEVVLDSTGYCGMFLGGGVDHNASNSATPAFVVSADGGAARYQMFIDGVSIGTFNGDSMGKACVRTTTPLSDGPHVITGNELAPNPANTTIPYSFSVDTVVPPPPTNLALNWSYDTGIAGDGMTNLRDFLVAGTSDINSGIKTVRLYRGGTIQFGGGSPQVTGNWIVGGSVWADGTYSVQATSVDQANNQSPLSTPPISITVDTVAPTGVAVTDPPANAVVSGSINLAAVATDNVGMWKVAFNVDGATKSTDTSSPYSFLWNSAAVANGTHTVTAVATDAAGNTTTSAPVTINVSNGTATVPGAPATLAATGGDNNVSLAWSAPTSNGGSAVTNYVVYRGTTSGGATQLTTLGNVTSWTDTTALNGVTYYYQVSAKNAVGEGPRTSERSAIPAGRPGVPPSFTATGGDGTVALSWGNAAANGSTVTTYRVYRGTASGGEVLVATLGSVNSWVDTGVANGTTYYYQVSAANAVGEGARSNEFPAAPSAAPAVPGAPASLSATGGDGTVFLSWGAASGSGITSYLVYRGSFSGGETLVATLGSVTSWTDTNVQNGLTYYYQVSARNGVGEGARSGERSAIPAGRPLAPGSPFATRGDNSVSLTWNAAAAQGSAVTNYVVYRGTASGGETLLTTLGNLTSWTDTSALNGVTYYYQVAAKNAIGEGSRSSEVSATPAGNPLAPTFPSASGGDGAVTVSWASSSPNGSAVTSYLVYRGTFSGGEVLVATLGNVNSWVDTGVANGTTYYYQVSARNAIGEGSRSAEASATPAGKPSAPTSPATTSGDGAVGLSWGSAGPNGSGVTSYLVYRGTFSGGEVLVATLGNVNSWVDPNVANGTTYYYQVSARNAIGEGARSGEASATPAGRPATPSLSASAGNGAVGLSWGSVAGNGSQVTAYLVYRGTVSGGETLVATLGNVTSWVDTTVANGTTYYYQVSAKNAIGEGARSAEAPATPQGPPSAPGSFTASAGDTRVSLSWSSSSGSVSNYLVYRGTFSGGETLVATLGNVNSWVDTNVANGVTYYYQVTAKGSAGESARSSERSATPGTVPGAPDLWSVTDAGAGIALSWSTPLSNGGSQITAYRIYRGTFSGGESAVPLATIPNQTTYTDTTTTPNVTYYYRVSAVNSAGEGALSNERFATDAADTTPPGIPTSLKAAISGTTQVAIYWTASTGDVAGYDVYRNGVYVGSSTKPNYLDSTGLAAGVTYNYQVLAWDAANNKSSLSTGVSKATVASSTSTTGTLGGVVYNSLGKPVANVVVTAVGPSGTKTAKTNNTGIYKFSNLKPGSYTMSANGSTFTGLATAGRTIIFSTSI